MKTTEEKALKYKSDPNKRVISYSLLTITFLSMHLYQSQLGMSNTWDCSTGALDAKYDLICYRLIQATSCRNIYGPMSLHAVFDIQTRYKGELSIQCPWSAASSELRISLSLLSLALTTYQLYTHITRSAINSSRIKPASIILSALLCITSTFDFHSLSLSHKHNSSLCSGSVLPHLGSGISTSSIQCDLFYFSLTPISSLVSSVSMVFTSYYYLHSTTKVETD